MAALFLRAFFLRDFFAMPPTLVMRAYGHAVAGV